jgi:nucleoside phosphorylase
MAVAEAMLDEKHNSLPTSPGDDNTYILGSVFAHNVVIACLPSGIYGTTSAATLASQIRNTFQSIRFGLMVGIGGGVPSTEHDIRLGDVVVSKPTRDFGGVIQFDYGKTTAGGQFERTGVLNKPPSVLLTAISRIQAAHMSSPSQVPIFLDDAAARNPSMKVNFTYCGEEQDQLFEFDYEHVESQSTCDKCDHTKLITRSIREENAPHVHYGLIASGNQVMKYGQTRQKLAQELGILCFEMEAAGLMDSFPCLVVRGICDYSDSHKNKQWQPYAAATAAAYAKELLSAIHASRVAEAPVNLYESDPQIQMRSFSNWISLKSGVLFLER